MKMKDITVSPIMKMQGCGNDFVVMTDVNEQITPEQARVICDRHFGIGADGLITILKSRVKGAKYRMKFFNPDGTIAEMCGNGIRCFAKYLGDHNSSGFTVQNVDTDRGIVRPEIVSNSDVEALVKVDMGIPNLYDPTQVKRGSAGEYGVRLEGDVIRGRIKGVNFTFVSMGNPHAVVFTDDPDKDVKLYGSILETYLDVFPKKTNVEFVKVNSSTDLTMRVWERGAGVTLACGTGACASLVASVLNNYVTDYAKIHLLGGDLDVSWDVANRNNHVFMTGPAKNVYEIKARDLDQYLFGGK